MCPDRVDIDRILAETFIAHAEHHGTLASTSDRACQLAHGTPGVRPLLVLADRQTAGRGRGPNAWWTGRGSLALSLLLAAEHLRTSQPSRSPMVSLAAALAVVETVVPRVPSQTVGIHWPNDVMAGGGKLAGILVEVLPSGEHVVGIGLNTNNSMAEAPPELRQTATTLLDLTGVRHDPTTVLVTLLRCLESAFGQLTSRPNRIGIQADQVCLQHGKTLTLRRGSRTTTGRCAGIAPDGALMLDTPEGRQSFYSGVLQHV